LDRVLAFKDDIRVGAKQPMHVTNEDRH
jgi:hypothetical protein